MTPDNDADLQAQIAELKAELENEKAKTRNAIRLQVSQKGACSLYGIRRFPITFYTDEWTTILDMEQEIRSFLVEHANELKQKS
jgi:hypothetical protein